MLSESGAPSSDNPVVATTFCAPNKSPVIFLSGNLVKCDHLVNAFANPSFLNEFTYSVLIREKAGAHQL